MDDFLSSPIAPVVNKIDSLKLNHENSAGLQSAHVFTSIGHDDGRNYVNGEAPMVRYIDLRGLSQAETYNLSTSGDVLSHQGVSLNKAGDRWVTSHSQPVGPVMELRQWSAIGSTPTPDAVNPNNLNLIDHSDFLAYPTLNHCGDIAHFSFDGNEYIAAPLGQNSSTPNAVGIAIYNAITLSYVPGSYSSLIGELIDPKSLNQVEASGVAINENLNEMFVVEFGNNTNSVFVFTLSDALTGDLALKRVINLDYAVEGKQSIYCRGGNFYIVGNGILLFKFDLNGKLKTVYGVHSSGTGPQGIDFSSDLLYWLDSPSSSTGFIETYDLFAAENAQIGREADGVSVRQWKSFYSPYITSFPESGTLSIRLKYDVPANSWDNPVNYIMNHFESSTSWALVLQSQGAAVRARFTPTNGTTIQTANGGVVDMLVDTFYDLTITWNRVGANVNTQIFLNNILRDSATSIWQSAPILGSLGPVNRYSTSQSQGIIFAHRYLYNRVLSPSEIIELNDNPYSMFNIL